MRHIFSILIALLLCVNLAAAETYRETNAVTLALKANASTGYSWTAFVLGGDSVLTDSEEGTYITLATDEAIVGAGGQTYFTLIPVQAGVSLIQFRYGRPWMQEAEKTLLVLAEVDENLQLHLTDVTDSSAIAGKVLSVNAAESSALLASEAHGEINVTFSDSTSLPAADEQIVVYTNGSLTLSLPAVANAIAWETVAPEIARIEAE